MKSRTDKCDVFILPNNYQNLAGICNKIWKYKGRERTIGVYPNLKSNIHGSNTLALNMHYNVSINFKVILNSKIVNTCFRRQHVIMILWCKIVNGLMQYERIIFSIKESLKLFFIVMLEKISCQLTLSPRKLLLNKLNLTDKI